MTEVMLVMNYLMSRIFHTHAETRQSLMPLLWLQELRSWQVGILCHHSLLIGICRMLLSLLHL